MSMHHSGFNAITIAICLAFSLGVSSASGSEPIAVAEGEMQGLRADITELKRSAGNTVSLRFTLVNGTGGNLNPRQIFGISHDLRQVHLIDHEGMKKYVPVMDSENNCVCTSGIGHRMENGASLNFWARFPAPPDEVKMMSIVLPRFIPAEVPVSE